MGKVFTPQELAERWSVSVQTVYNMVKEGRLPAFHLGKSVRITEDTVNKFEGGHTA